MRALTFLILIVMAVKGQATPYRRFSGPLDRMEESLKKSPSAASAVEPILAGDTRGQLFRLQALLRLYAKHDVLGEKAKALNTAVKAFEDALGKYDESTGVLKFARDVKAPEGLVSYLVEKERLARQTLVVFLQQAKWVPYELGAHATLKRELQGFQWDSPNDDRKFFLKRVRKSVEKVDDQKYDLDELEAGIHELRRDLRWISIDAAASGGTILLSDDCPYENLQWLLNDPIAKSPYVKLLPSPEEDKPCRISKCVFFSLAKAVDDFGQLKDVGQMEHFLKVAIRESGIPTGSESAKELAISLVRRHKLVTEKPENAEVFKTAKRLYEKFKKGDTLKYLAVELDRCD